MNGSTKRFTRFLTPAAILALGIGLGTIFSDSLRPAAAVAQQPGTPTTTPPFNSMEERKQMLTALNAINDRLAKIETKLNSGLSVKVTEMPPVTVKENK